MVKNISRGLPQQIKNTNNPARADKRDPKVLQAAQMYEEQFLKQMVDAMRKAVPRSELTKESMGEKIFTDQLYDQYVEQWTNVGGVGLSNLIYDQIMEKFGPQKNIEHPQGPLPMDQHKTFQIKDKSPRGAMMLQISPQKNANENSEILMPWKGQLTSVQNLDSGEKAAFFQHENGLRSTFLFQGNIPLNKKVFGPGELIAVLQNKKDFFWKLEKV